MRKQILLQLQHCMFHGFNVLHEVLLWYLFLLLYLL